ncbi:MAG TPA: nucleotidyltransferase family protein [Gemmatimonadaceae bacterium]|nr:nucleotidyltransferase family protein [Gemmatimonadaceae bacterium]
MRSPEARLVFRNADPSCSNAEYGELARAVTDWPRAFGIAEREMATASVWRALRQAEAPVPADAGEAFARGTMIRELRSQHLAHRLAATTRVLAERRIPSLLLKGASVGAMIDPSFRARPMSDVDLLVHREDTARASEAIIAAGWPMTTDPLLLELLKDHHHLPHFVDPQLPGVRLELHVQLWPTRHPFAFDESDLWREARPAPTPFAGSMIPSPEHLLVHTSAHFAWQHAMRFGAWRTVRSVAAATGAPGFSWESFVRVARASRAATACYWTLRLANAMSGLPVPPRVLASLAPPGHADWLDALERHFIADLVPGEGVASPSIRLSSWLWRAAIRPGWSGHGGVSPWDFENEWGRKAGTAVVETTGERLRRHLASVGDWSRFVTGTLLR